jgi:hypothetical protein
MIVSGRNSVGAPRGRAYFGGAVEKEHEHPWIRPKDGTSNVTVTVANKDVLLEVQCPVGGATDDTVFDAIKSLNLDVLSVQDSAPDGFMELKIRAQVSVSPPAN